MTSMYNRSRYDYDQDDERIEAIFISREVRTARVERTCQECGYKILPDQRYVRECWKVDGEMWAQGHHYRGEDCPVWLGTL